MKSFVSISAAIVLVLVSTATIKAQESKAGGTTKAASTKPEPASPSLQFVKVASVPIKNEDHLKFARLALSFEHQSLLSRNFIVSGGENVRGRTRAFLWSWHGEQPKQTRLPDSTTIGFVPNRELAYQVHWGQGVRFYDTQTHKTSGKYIPHELREDTTMGPSVSPSGNVMVTRSQLDHLRFWDLETREPITEELKQVGNVYSMGFSPDNKWFYSHSRSMQSIWDAKTGKLAGGPFAHNSHVFAYSPITNQVVTLDNNDKKKESWNCQVVVRSATKGFKPVAQIQVDGHAREAHWLGDKRLLIVADNRSPGQQRYFPLSKKLAYVVSLEGDQPKVTTTTSQPFIRDCQVAPDGEHFVIRSRDETSFWNAKRDKPLWTVVSDPKVYFGGKDWVLMHRHGATIAYSLTTGKELARIDDVVKMRSSGANVWTQHKDRMHVWRVERELK